MVFFLVGRLDFELGILGCEGGEEKVLTVEEHMLKRMATSYGTGTKVVGEDGLAV